MTSSPQWGMTGTCSPSAAATRCVSEMVRSVVWPLANSSDPLAATRSNSSIQVTFPCARLDCRGKRSALPAQVAEEVACTFHLRRIEDLRGWALFDNGAVLEHHHVVGDAAGEVHLVRHD